MFFATAKIIYNIQQKDFGMKKLTTAVLGLYTIAFIASFVATISDASAACPKGTRYDCYQTFNGKQSCGCR
jgi:hypothetical protein